MGGACGSNTYLVQGQLYHSNKAVEGKANVVAIGNHRQHQVVHIGIDAATTTFPSNYTYIMLATIVEINFVFNYLISPKDYGWGYLPHKKAIGFLHMSRHILLHRQIKRQLAIFVGRQGDIFHM